MKGNWCAEILIPLALGVARCLTTRGLFVYSPGPHDIVSSFSISIWKYMGTLLLDIVLENFFYKGSDNKPEVL